jgi:hypothetical protein
MTRWEYKMIGDREWDINEGREQLEHWGKQGWELVCLLPRGPMHPLFYLKRPLETPRP